METASAASAVKPPAKTEARRRESPLSLVEQIVRPLYGVAQRLMPFERPARPSGEQAEALVQLGADLCWAHRANARRGQLDGQRYPVEPAADLGDGFDVGRELEGRHDRSRPFVEQPNRR